MKNLNELSKRIDELKNLNRMFPIELNYIKFTLTAMLGELDLYIGNDMLRNRLKLDIQNLIDKINGEKT